MTSDGSLASRVDKSVSDITSIKNDLLFLKRKAEVCLEIAESLIGHTNGNGNGNGSSCSSHNMH